MQANLLGVIRVLARLAPSLRVGFVAFKDRGDAYLTLTFPLSPMTQGNVGQVVEFVGRMSADGGGDDPEPVDEALRVATAMPWRGEAQGRILVVGDAPARPSGRGRALELADSSGARRPTRRGRARSPRSSPARPPGRTCSTSRSPRPAAATSAPIRGRSSRTCCCRC